MPWIRLIARRRAGAPAEVPAPPGTTLLDAIDAAGAPLGRSCRGEGICRSCVVRVCEGAALVAPPGELERRARARGLSAVDRLACQARIADDADEEGLVSLWAPAWGEPEPGT